MDHAAFLVTLGVIATLVATTYGLLPERLDLSHVFAAYGAGNILGEIVAARRGVLGVERTMRRWGRRHGGDSFDLGAGAAARDTVTAMFPSEVRRWRRAMIAGVPYAVMVSVLAEAGDWSVGWIWLSIAVFMASAMLYVHRERPGERAERQQFRAGAGPVVSAFAAEAPTTLTSARAA